MARLLLLIKILIPTLLLFFSADASYSEIRGVVVPIDGGEQITLPLRSMDISVNIIDGIAEVTMAQTFLTGKLTGPSESHYQLPVDPTAAVTKFAAAIDDRVVRAVVKAKEEAKKEYEDAVAAGKGAYLAEQQVRDVFKISLGNLPPDELVRIEFVYVAPLEAMGEDVLAFVLPTAIAPRYEPLDMGQGGIDPHADLIDPGVRIELNVTMVSPVVSVTSPSHAIKASTIGTGNGFAKHVIVSEEDPLVRDLVVHIKTESTFRPQLFIEHSLLYSSTAMLLSFVPPVTGGNTVKKSEFIFVVDRSGSMDGVKMTQTRKALRKVVESLPAESLFNIVGFGSDSIFLFDTSQSIDDKKSLGFALEYVDAMEADMGGTEILAPLQKIHGRDIEGGFFRQIFVFTDGQVGNTDRTIEFIGEFDSNSRVFSLGIGSHVSRALVQGIARNGRGTAEFVEGNDDTSIYEAVERQMAVALSPVLDNAVVDWGLSGEQAPYITPPLLLGKRYIAYFLADGTKSSELGTGSVNNTDVFFETKSDLSVKITAYGGTSNVKYEFEVMSEDMIVVSGLYSGNMIHKMAAQVFINDLEDGGSRMHYNPDLNEAKIVEKIVEVGVKYQLSSSETSFIAVDNYNWTIATRGDLDDGGDIYNRGASGADSFSLKFIFGVLFVLPFVLW